MTTNDRIRQKILPGILRTSVFHIMRERRINRRAEGTVLISSGRLAYTTSDLLDRPMALQDVSGLAVRTDRAAAEEIRQQHTMTYPWGATDRESRCSSQARSCRPFRSGSSRPI